MVFVGFVGHARLHAMQPCMAVHLPITSEHKRNQETRVCVGHRRPHSVKKAQLLTEYLYPHRESVLKIVCLVLQLQVYFIAVESQPYTFALPHSLLVMLSPERCD